MFATRLKFLLVVQKHDRDLSSESVATLLDLLFQCLVLQTGFESISTCPSSELLKQIISQAELLMENILSIFLNYSDLDLSFLLDAVLVAHPLNSPKIVGLMDSFCKSFGLNYALVYLEDRTVAMSTETSKLKSEEILLVRLFVDIPSNNQLKPSAPPEEASRSASPAYPFRSASSRNVSPVVSLNAKSSSHRTVFLPQTSPNLAYRLFTINLENSDGILVLLAGSDCVMNEETRKKMETCITSESNFLKRSAALPPLWFSEKLAQNLPKELYGVVIRNMERNLVFCSPVNEALSETRKNQRRQSLIEFVQKVEQLCKMEGGSSSRLLPSLNDIYHFSGSFKFYFLCRGPYEAYCMFDTVASKHSLLSTAEEVLNVFTRQKNE